jgi:hypothetical protein
MLPVMRFFLWLLYPVAATLLDYLTEPDGAPAEVYNRGELSAFVRIQHETLRGARMSGVLKKERSKE